MARYVPPAEAAAYGGITTRTIKNWIDDGRLPAYKLGPRLVRINLDDIDRMLQRIVVSQSGEPAA